MITSRWLFFTDSKERYVKQLSTAKPPWQEDSEFLSLAAEFAAWRQSLPQSILWNPGAIYARKESSELGAFTLLWCTYHQSLVDLYRIGMPTLFRIQKDIAFPPDQQDFLDDCRRVCFENARDVSYIISEALRHGLKVLADTWFCIIAHDSTKVMLYYLKLSKSSIVRLDNTQVNGTISLVHRNLESLLQMRPMVATAEHCVCNPFYFFVLLLNHSQLLLVCFCGQNDGKRGDTASEYVPWCWIRTTKRKWGDVSSPSCPPPNFQSLQVTN